MKRGSFFAVGFAVLVLLLTGLAPQPARSAETYVLMMEKTPWIRLEQQGAEWKVASSSTAFMVVRSGKGYEIRKGRDKLFTVADKDGKLSVQASSGTTVLRLKETAEKIKIYRGADEKSAWEIKKKDDGDAYKVMEGERKLGKVKFYADKSLIKVKDEAGSELCRMGANRNEPAAAVCLLQRLPEDQRLALFALLLLSGNR